MTRPAPPKGLGARGRRVWRSVHAELPDALELGERDLEVLRIAASRSDDLDALEKVLQQDGHTAIGSTGQHRLHPAIAEIRQMSLAIQRLLGSIDLSAPASGVVSPSTARAQKAINVRWARERQQRERRGS